ncbi:hypothetical protein AX768_09075 [Burkholderia sp. PAMC 28687]|uniref:hypothetical protein n=1 Tax=Burkholderia sp. PAMC 28687 TaxID=1795874 RepID=UPI00078197E8|nr:hypothetical protein [Burkholderia sp. PAMC 28687]AMM14222.1 hypothetical protein AX768_09075 [Burkholderia sp. PAMC 28687]
MTPNDKAAFLAVLSRTFRTLRQPVPEPEILDVWWAKLEPFPIEAIASAFSKHLDVSEFAPTPAAILRHLPRESDGRPGTDEAWAIALRSRDERDTVVWTEEIAEAFEVSKSVIDGDEIGARMAFRDAYTRICERNRVANLPAKWVISQGFDAARREEVVRQAVREGRLQIAHAVAVVPLLASESDGPACVDVEANLSRLKRLVSGIEESKARALAAKAQRAREDQEALIAAKAETARRVAEYEANHGS